MYLQLGLNINSRVRNVCQWVKNPAQGDESWIKKHFILQAYNFLCCCGILRYLRINVFIFWDSVVIFIIQFLKSCLRFVYIIFSFPFSFQYFQLIMKTYDHETICNGLTLNLNFLSIFSLGFLLCSVTIWIDSNWSQKSLFFHVGRCLFCSEGC